MRPRDEPTLGKSALAKLVTLLIAMPLIALDLWATGGPVGHHARAWWICGIVIIIVSSVVVVYLPPPWNGGYRDRGFRGPKKRREAAEQLLAKSQPELSAERVADARLLIDSGYPADAEDLIREEIRQGRAGS